MFLSGCLPRCITIQKQDELLQLFQLLHGVYMFSGEPFCAIQGQQLMVFYDVRLTKQRGRIDHTFCQDQLLGPLIRIARIKPPPAGCIKMLVLPPLLCLFAIRGHRPPIQRYGFTVLIFQAKNNTATQIAEPAVFKRIVTYRGATFY